MSVFFEKIYSSLLCVLISGVFFSCNIYPKNSSDSVHINDRFESWVFSGILKDKKTAQIYSLSYLVFHRGDNSDGKGLFSSHIAITDFENNTYYYEIFNPASKSDTAPDYSENLNIRFGNNLQDFLLKAQKRNYLLKARSQTKKKLNIKLFLNRKMTNQLSTFCVETNTQIFSHAFSFLKKTKGKLNFAEEKMKVSGDFFYNRFYNANSLIQSQQEKYLMNIQLDSTQEFYTLIFASGKDTPEVFDILSVCSNKKSLSKTDFQIKPVAFWESPKMKKIYPVQWEIKMPSENIILTAIIENQEIQWMKNSYWMGAYWITSDDSTKKIGKATAIIF